jgi:hypothetical protein
MPLDELTAPKLSAKDMPYVSFERGEPREDKAASRKEGRPVYVDTYYACITSPGSKDRLKEEIPDWWEKLDTQAKTGRVDPDWVERWKKAFARFREGLEIPEDGTPILGWNLLPPSMQKVCLDCNIRTVEALANMTDEARQRIGMGAREMERRAQAWLAQNQDKGPLTIKMADIERENAELKGIVASLEQKVKALSEQLGGDTAKPALARPRTREA